MLLERLVQNLIDNAIGYNLGEGGWVAVGTAVVGKNRRLTVENTGPPIRAYAVPSLFEPFRRQQATTIRASARARYRGRVGHDAAAPRQRGLPAWTGDPSGRQCRSRSAYAWAFSALAVAPNVTWAWGVGIGLVHWLVAGVAMGLVPRLHPRMPSAHQTPGWFVTRFGRASAVVFPGGHVVYGLLVGAIYPWLASPPSF